MQTRLVSLLVISFLLFAPSAWALTPPQPVRAAPCDRVGCGKPVVIGYAGPGLHDLLATLRRADGRRIALFRGGRGSAIMWRRSVDRHRWGRAHLIAAYGWAPRLAQAPDGSVVAGWSVVTTSPRTGVRFAVIRHGVMSPARTMVGCAFDMQLVRDPQGSLLVACATTGGTALEYPSGRILLGEWPQGAHAFGRLTQLAGSGTACRGLSLAARGGRVVLAWGEVVPDPGLVIPRYALIRVAVRDDAIWRPPVTVATGLIEPTHASVSPDGTATVTWAPRGRVDGPGQENSVATARPGAAFQPAS